MNKRFKIMVGVYSLLFLTLMILSFTYAYLAANIEENTNEKSFEVKLGKSEIVYTDLEISSDSDTITPGSNTYMKFTIENISETNAEYFIYLMEVYNDFIRTGDIQYTLYRQNGNNTLDISELSKCSESVDSECRIMTTGTFPTEDTMILSDEKSSEGDRFYTYILKISYINQSNISQDSDIGHKFSAKIQIHGSDSIEYISSFKDGTLADAIYTSAKKITSINDNKTIYKSNPSITPLGEINDINEKVLGVTSDDYGKTLYLRGNVVDNYVNFANMCWRVVRIEEDGSTKLILEDINKTCEESTGDMNLNANYGYSEYSSGTLNSSDGLNNGENTYLADYINSTTNEDYSMVNILKNFQNTNLSEYLKYLKQYDLCFNDVQYNDLLGTNILTDNQVLDYKIKGEDIYYDSYLRLYGDGVLKYTLKCDNKVNIFSDNTPMYVGTITLDEIIYAGGTSEIENQNYYLNNGTNYWTLTKSNFTNNNDNAFYVKSDGSVSYDKITSSYGVRPTVILSKDIKIKGGDGMKTTPYIITES